MKKKPSIIDLIEKLEPPNIDPEADLTALYYESKYGKYIVFNEEVASIKAGLADIEAEKVHTHEEGMAYMNEKYSHLKKPDSK